MRVPISVLDLAPLSAGSDAPTALRNTVDLAQHAEAWGYRRYWVAEHHYVAVASASPAVLIGQIAAATNTIRVGAAAVQLGHTTAIAVVESFATLDAFHPGRIDLGVGRSGQRRTEAIREKPREPRPPREWHEVDGVVVPTPFDVSVLMRNPRLRATMGYLAATSSRRTGFRRSGRRYPGPAQRHLPGGRIRGARYARRGHRTAAVGVR